MKILVAGITGDRLDVSTQFAMSLLRLQMDVAPRQDLQLTVTFLNSLNDALNTALDSEADVLVAADARVSFPGSFVLGAEDAPDVVVGVHPLPAVDWDRVKKAAEGGQEPLESSGFAYNVVPHENSPCKRYMRIGDGTTRVLRIKKKAILELALLAETPTTGSKIFVRDGVIDGQFVPRDRWLLKTYKKAVFADVESPCGYAGVAEFAGCVGQRQQLR